MKTLYSSENDTSGNFENSEKLPGNRPLRICVAFDEVASARNADVMITNLAADYQCAKQSFCFDELDAPGPGVAAARKVAGTDLLILAARGDLALPAHIRLWLGLCLGLRDEGDEGALVALITNVDGCEALHSSILEYLETIAIIGGVTFFPRKPNLPMTLKAKEKRLPRASLTT